ncbi:MAG: hypothetical protein RH950_12600 [Nisaea sp.]
MFLVGRSFLQAFIPGRDPRHGRPFQIHAEEPVEMGSGRNIRQTGLRAAEEIASVQGVVETR